MAKKQNLTKKFFLIILIIGFLAFVFIALIDLSVAEKSRGLIYKNISEAPNIKVGLVLGASVWNNKVMSDMLKDRADTALELYRNGKIEKFLVSGDNGKKEYNEVIVVKNYLLEQGIPESDIYLDYAGLDTYDSLFRARDIFGVDKLIIFTQEFHLPRAVYIGKELGLDVYGFSSDRHNYRNIEFNKFREKFANIKAFFEIKLNLNPKFLGEKVLIN